jgi:hypothetical protein
MASSTFAAREARVRRQAQAAGLSVRKVRGSRNKGMVRGPYMVIDPFRNVLLAGEHGMVLDEVEDWLAE